MRRPRSDATAATTAFRRAASAAAAALLLLAGAASPAHPADAGAILVTLDRASYTGDRGGEFQVVTLTGATVPAMGPGVAVAGGVFQTFCLETTQHLLIDTPLTWTLSASVAGGGFSGGSPDPIDARTAYLYTRFWDGSLAGYSYEPGPARIAAATSLQRAIYAIEGELVGAIQAEFDGDPRAHAWVAEADAAVAPGGGWSGLGAVRALNLTDSTCADLQSVLVMTAEQAPCALGVTPPVALYDAVLGAATSRFAGPTRDLAAGDVDGDGLPDLLNLTPTGAQILRNDGTTGGVLRFTLIQEFAVDSGHRGGFLDLDGDCDLDLVIGDADYVLAAINDGTGHFEVRIVHDHHFAVSAIAVPFDVFTDATRPGNRHRFLLAGTSDAIAATALQVPSLLSWAQVFEFGDDGRATLLQTIGPVAADDVIPRDLDGDGDIDLLVSSRSDAGAGPLVVFESLAADTPGGLYAADPAHDLVAPPPGGLTWRFGYGAAVGDDGSVAVGSWHRSVLWRRDGGTGWTLPVEIAADPGFLQGWPGAEILATGLGDLDCDGRDDLVFQGVATALVLVNLSRDTEHPSSRFLAAPAPGVTRDLVVLDWDRDDAGALDVVTGGTRGVWFHRNVAGGPAAAADDAAPPPAPPTAPEPCNEAVYGAMTALENVIDPAHVPPLADPVARVAVAGALAKLHGIDPYYLVGGTLAQPSPPLVQMQTIYTRLGDARALLVSALGSPGLDPAFKPALTGAADDLVAAAACLAESAVALGGVTTKRTPADAAQRLIAQARADLRIASRLGDAAASATSLRAYGRRGDLAIERYARAFRRAAAALTIRSARG